MSVHPILKGIVEGSCTPFDDLVDQAQEVVVVGQPDLESRRDYAQSEKRPVPMRLPLSRNKNHLADGAPFEQIIHDLRGVLQRALRRHRPDAASRRSPSITNSSISCRLPAGSLAAHAPQSIPMTLLLLSNT